jgi:hypothetical protein
MTRQDQLTPELTPDFGRHNVSLAKQHGMPSKLALFALFVDLGDISSAGSSDLSQGGTEAVKSELLSPKEVERSY